MLINDRIDFMKPGNIGQLSVAVQHSQATTERMHWMFDLQHKITTK